MNIHSDNAAVLAGYTKEYMAESDFHSVHILTKPDVDLDGTFTAYDCDNCEMIRINGWNWSLKSIN